MIVRCLHARYLSGRLRKKTASVSPYRRPPARRYATLGIFGDIHFQDKGLDRINKTANWIVEELIRREVDAVVCLGDVLNTREQVSVRALSSALTFFDRLSAMLNSSPARTAPSFIDAAAEKDPACLTRYQTRKKKANHHFVSTTQPDPARSLCPKPLHIILGNHDINLKYSRRYSSLDALSMFNFSSRGLYLHREATLVKDLVPGIHALMLPYYESSADIAKVIRKFAKELGPDMCALTLVFGHLSIHGAQPNNSLYKYHGELRAGTFASFRRTFSGHFHHHHELTKNRVVYVGSPLQFNFGDAGDTRGIVIYDTNKDDYEFVSNPYSEQFVIVPDFQLEYELFTHPDPSENRFEDKFVQVQLTTDDLTDHTFNRLQTALLDSGALSVIKATHCIGQMLNNDRGPLSSSQNLHLRRYSSLPIECIIRQFMTSVRDTYLKDRNKNSSNRTTPKKATQIQQRTLHFLEQEESFEEIIRIGLEIAQKASTKKDTEQGGATQTTFHARLKSLTIRDFLGIQNEVTIPFGDMNSGIWFIEGPNGAGKSTIFEAIVWCQFGEFLRSGMQKDYAINDLSKDCMVRLEYENGLVIERARRRGRTEYVKCFKRVTASSQKHACPNSKVRPSPAAAHRGPRKSKDPPATTDNKANSRKAEKDAIEIVAAESSLLDNEYEYQEESELGAMRDTQKQLCCTLGINFDIFSKSIVLGQNIVSNFVSGNQEQKRSIIEEMLGLDRFNDWQEIAKSERLQLEQQIAVFEAQMNLLNQSLNSLNEQKTRLETSIRSQKLQVTNLEAKIKQVVEVQDNYLDSIKEEIRKNRQTLKDADLSKLEARIASFPRAELSLLTTEIASYKCHLQAFMSLEASGTPFCATCGQPVSELHIQKILKDAQNSMFRLISLIENCSVPFSRSVPALSTLSEKADVYMTAIDDVLALSNATSRENEQNIILQKQLQELYCETIRLENQLLQGESATLKKLENLNRELHIARFQSEKYDISLADISSRIEVLQAQLCSLNNELSGCRQKCSMHKFWEMAFDKQSRGTISTIRAFMLSDAIRDLNIIIRGYTEQLQVNGNQTLPVSLTSDLELEQIYSKRSGGERKRTDLAILFSLFELIRAQSRYVPDFLMLDEVFDSLDQEGREMVGQALTFLSQRLEKVLVITHTDISSGLSIAGVCHVKMMKNEQGESLGTAVDIVQT